MQCNSALSSRKVNMVLRSKCKYFESKIGGEMVPHVAAEDALLGGLDTEERVLAVTAVPDEKRGERLIVLHTADSGGAEKLQQILQVSDLPNL